MNVPLCCLLALAVSAHVSLSGASEGSAQSGAAPVVAQQKEQRFDPLGGEYPQFMWMVNVLEADGPLQFGEDGLIQHRSGEGRRAVALTKKMLDPTFASFRSLPGYRNVAAPALFTKPGAHGVLEPNARDKAQQSIGRRMIDVVASFRNQNTLAVEVKARDEAASGSNEVRTNTMDVSVDGGLAMILPSPDSDTWSIIVVRPSVIRSVKDFPFQTSRAVERVPFDPLKGDYPQIFWHAEIFEIDSGIEISDDGKIIPSTRVKGRGLAVIDAEGRQKLFESISAMTDMREVSEPSLLTKLDATGKIEIGAKDKAGRASLSHALEVKGGRVQLGIEVVSTITNSVGEFSISVCNGSTVVGPGGVLVVIAPPPKEGSATTLLVLRPSLMESVKDYPFQTAEPIPQPPVPSVK